ncbi:MAG: chloride channel protein, partial [Rhodothermales bacterium]
GIGAIFRSPLGAAFFADDHLYREDLESQALMPAAIASITGYSIYSSVVESASIFTTPSFSFVSPIELVPLVPFAIVCAVVGMMYVTFFYATKRRFFDVMPIPRWLKPAVGGLLVGCIAFFFPAILGSSYGWLQQAIEGNLPVILMATLVGAKIVATSLTIGSGGSGGVFAPSLVIGGMLGGIFGVGVSYLSPELVTQPGAYVMIGMATFFTGVANVPISTTIMISEMTGSYTLLVPLLFAGVIVYVTARRWSLYTEQLRTSNDSPAHKHELTPDLLSSTTVASVIEYPVQHHTLEPSNTIVEVLHVFTRTREVVLPVADGTDGDRPRYTGLVLLEDVQSLMQSGEAMQHLIIARDVEVPFASVALTDTLDRVLDVFLEKQYPELPVVDEDKTIVGFIRQGQVISEYYRAYLRRKAEDESTS